MTKPPPSNDGIPKKCPVCRSRDLDVNREPDDDEFDSDLAVDCGFDAHCWREEFHHCQAHAECNRCGEWWGYGPDWYFNPDTGSYDRTREDVLRFFGVLPETINDPSLYERPLL